MDVGCINWTGLRLDYILRLCISAVAELLVYHHMVHLTGNGTADCTLSVCPSVHISHARSQPSNDITRKPKIAMMFVRLSVCLGRACIVFMVHPRVDFSN